MDQEHGFVEPIKEEEILDYSKYPVGSHLSILPYHVSKLKCKIFLGNVNQTKYILYDSISFLNLHDYIKIQLTDCYSSC